MAMGCAPVKNRTQRRITVAADHTETIRRAAQEFQVRRRSAVARLLGRERLASPCSLWTVRTVPSASAVWSAAGIGR